MMTRLKRREISRMTTRAASSVDSKGRFSSLTRLFKNVTINPIEGDKESRLEIQPHLNSGLWPGYIEECAMRYELPPTDGRQEAPGAATPNPPSSE